jgi:signal transduction histidine kinase
MMMKQVKLLFVADHVDDLPPLASLAEQAGCRVAWQVATEPAALVQALGEGGIDGIFSAARPWGGDVVHQVLAPVASTVPVVVLCDGQGDLRRAPDLIAAGALDVLSLAEPWRLKPAVTHIAERREQARLREEKERRADFIEVVQQLSMVRSMAEVMAIVRSAARRLAQADGATFVLRDEGFCHYADEDAIAPLWKGQRFPMGQCISGWAMLNRQPAVIEDVFADPRIPVTAYEPTFVRSLVMVPIRTRDPIGAIGTYWARHHRPTEDDVELLQTLADTTAVAIENVRLQEGLERRVQERTEQLRLANEELEAFSSSVSHDLRNPLNAIDGFSALMEMDLTLQSEAQTRQQLGHVREAARRMNAIINDLLTLARAGRGELCRQRVDLSAMAHEIVAGLRSRSPQRQVEVQVTPGLAFDCDPGLARIALENLLSNAWKYSSKKERAHIEFSVQDRDAEPPVFYVYDNGAGFDPCKAAKLFKPFQRLHPESEFAGIGVGLTTVRRVVNRHGGEVWASASPGKGATFFFTLARRASVVGEGGKVEARESAAVTL